MSKAMTRWWRAGLVAAAGGAAVGGGWFGVTRVVRADPANPPTPAPAVWSRARTPPPAAVPAPAPVVVPAPAAVVVPAVAAVPVAAPGVVAPPPADINFNRVIPASAMTPVVPPRPAAATVSYAPPAPLPLPPAAAATPAAPLVPEFRPAAPGVVSAMPVIADLPPLPPVPGGTTIPAPALPAPAPLPAPLPAPAPITLPAPAVVPTPAPAVLPSLPEAPVFKPVATPRPTPPSVPTPSDPAPPPPMKPPAPATPVLPPAPDFNLRPGDGGNNVKSGGPAEAVKPPAPAPAARPDDRPKPAEAAFGASEKYVFPIPPAAPGPVTAVPTSRPVPPAAPVVPELPGTGTASPNPTGAPAETPDARATTPGDRTMTFKQSAAAAVIGGALAFTPATPVATALPLSTRPVAVTPPPPAALDPLEAGIPARRVIADPVKDKDKPADDKVNDKLNDIQRDIKRMTELLDGRRDETGAKLSSDPGLVEEMKRMRDKIHALENQVADLKKTTTLRPTPAPGVTTPPTPPPAADPLAGKGAVLVINDYQVEITIVLNNNSYRVAANTELRITVPVGEFTYQLLSAGTNLAPTKSVIKEKEVVKLRIK